MMADKNDLDTSASERPRPGDDENRLREKDTASQPDDGGEDELPDEGGDEVEEELEKAREHADPTLGDKLVDGGDRVSTEEGGNPQE